MTRILFLCIHNSARSQMAEAYLKKFGGENFFAESAGLEAGKLNPLAVEVMKEDGIDISNNQTNDVFEFFKEGRLYNYVVTVCDEGNAAKCPVFPSAHKKINWSFDDPSQFAGSHEEKLAATRIVRDKIREAVIGLIKELS
ncbi:MAG TPA: arsenate reductase ArsC [Bacteroidia bacterium]|nr:arsenate reductase ArsC [Bacteroidia bacterium]HNU34489.1 arsenate reductase ArsC [Bacteroidia bacterium]